MRNLYLILEINCVKIIFSNKTFKPALRETQGHTKKASIETYHDDPHWLCHLPFKQHNGDEDSNEHEEEHPNVASHADRADDHVLAVDECVQKPGHRETNCYVKQVGANGRRHSHVSMTSLGYDDRGDQVRDRGSCCKEGDAHGGIRDTSEVADLSRPPDHDVSEDDDPDQAAEERERKELLELLIMDFWFNRK